MRYGVAIRKHTEGVTPEESSDQKYTPLIFTEDPYEAAAMLIATLTPPEAAEAIAAGEIDGQVLRDHAAKVAFMLVDGVLAGEDTSISGVANPMGTVLIDVIAMTEPVEEA